MSMMQSAKEMTRRRPLRIAAIGATSAAAIALLVGLSPLEATAERTAAPQASDAAQTTVVWPGYADLIEQVMPSVVGVVAARDGDLTVGEERRGPQQFPRFGEEGPDSEMFRRFMERFFGEQTPPFEMPRPPRGMPFGPAQAMGSGFIVDASGLIVTNNHVIDGASEVTVKLHDGTELTGQVVGKDPDTDLALVKVETDHELQPVSFADSDRVRVGDPVIAIGSPFGLGGTVTAGIVSAENRTIGAGRYDDFLQIDAPINRGNSGGPTFNLAGEVIGVNTLIHSPSGGNVGIGFAIPANLAKRVIADLEEDGAVTRGWLGVHIQSLDADLAAGLGLDEAAGALVAQVTPDSPAAAAGLQQGDVIVEYNGEAIGELRDLTRAVADTDPGKDAELVIWRDDARQSLAVEIGQMPGEDQMAMAEDRPVEADDAPELGLGLARLTPEARASLDLPADQEGVVVTEVRPGSPAAEKGLRSGDVIVEAGRQQVSDPDSIVDAVRAAAERGDNTILLLVKRDGQNRFVAVPLARA